MKYSQLAGFFHIISIKRREYPFAAVLHVPLVKRIIISVASVSLVNLCERRTGSQSETDDTIVQNPREIKTQ